MSFAFRQFLLRRKIATLDRIRFSKIVRWFLFQWKVQIRSWRSSGTTRETLARIEKLCSAARLAVSDRQILAVEKRIASLAVDPAEVAPLLAGETDDVIRKVAIIKPFNQQTGEQGVVFISFEYEWAKLLASPDLDEFAKRYTLVVSPTWTPPHSAVNCLFPRLYPGPIYCLISNKTDLETFPRLSKDYRMVDLFASSWVDPDLFNPRPGTERDIDLIMLANFGVYKRHHALFRALRDLPDDWKVVLVGQPNGARTAEVLLAEAEAFGVRDRIDLRQRVSDEEVCELLSRAKMSLICSRREGSCVAVVESMFADTPVALLNGAGIGSAAFVNDSTGAFLDESRLAEELESLHQKAGEMEPRKWCLENGIDTKSSSKRLNEILAGDSRERGLPWTTDIQPMHWRPNPLLTKPEDAPWSADETQKVNALTGIRFGE